MEPSGNDQARDIGSETVLGRLKKILTAPREGNGGRRLDSTDTQQLCASQTIALVLGSERLSAHNDPVSLVNFIVGCMRPYECEVRTIREARPRQSGDTYGNRFDALTRVLQAGAPPLTLQAAVDIGEFADELFFRRDEKENLWWAGDIGIHARACSTRAEKGRFLSSAVRVLRPRQCLELGTAYGMSSLFILSQLESFVEKACLTTVEETDTQYRVSSDFLKNKYGDLVECKQADIAESLTGICSEIGEIDFVFHDAGHSGENNVRDFQRMEPSLPRGAVVVVDDIRWTNPLYPEPAMSCYDGWLEIVGHQRVRRAVEVNRGIGMVQLD